MKAADIARTLAALLALVVLPALPARAHHSPAAFDLTKDVTLEGTVTEVSWTNPHIYINLEVTAADGRVTTQRIEGGSPSSFFTAGADANSLHAGDHVTVQVKPNRRGAGQPVLGWLLTKADGTTIPLHVRAIPQRAETEAQATGLAGTWVPQASGFAGLAVAAAAWPLTDAGRAAVASTAEARNATRSQCIPFGPPALMALPTTVIVEQTGDILTFRIDFMDATRTVHLDQARHPDALEPSLQGHSIGHFEGDTLVVDTIGYREHPDGFAFDRPSSAAKHIVERFTLMPDRRHVDYAVTIEDPEYLAGPVSHRSQWDYRPEQKVSNLPCDLDVARQFIEYN